MSFQILLFLLWNTNENILKDAGNQNAETFLKIPSFMFLNNYFIFYCFLPLSYRFDLFFSFFFSGLEQVLEFMYTAKLTLNPQNIEDVLAVATFLQMQEIVNACSAFQSLTVPATPKPG